MSIQLNFPIQIRLRPLAQLAVSKSLWLTLYRGGFKINCILMTDSFFQAIAIVWVDFDWHMS
jgi:hypothetical protein